MTTTETHPVDQDRAAAFAERMVGVLNDASLALLVSVGHQVRLFDAMAQLGWATSEEIADCAGLTERYVREWLGGMTTGRVVVYDPTRRSYLLPPEHAASLTRAAGPDNLARVLQFVPLLAHVEPQVVDAFRHGGGVPYSAYERFHELMAEDSATVVDTALIEEILPLVPGLPARLADGIEVADIGCGQGHAINVMARAFPRSRFVGYDFSTEAVDVARDEARAWGLDNARFEVLDVATLDVVEGFDLVTAFDAIHDQARPTEVLSRINRAVRRGGIFFIVDIKASSHLEENLDNPFAPFLYTASVMHCMTVSLALDGEGLGTVWGQQRALGMLDDAGFTDVVVHHLDTDPFNTYYVARR